ncbi:MAG: hypothetical protein NXI01_01550 [Gammaproteobacteria bacterium]|nr:hypothetical protein [Gammaproteobacteria bacterium]
MDNSRKLKELQQRTARDIPAANKHTNTLIAKVNSSGLSQTAKNTYLKLLNEQAARLNTLGSQTPPKNQYEALQFAQTQREELSKIVGNLTKIKDALNSKLGTQQAPPQRPASPAKTRAAAAPPQNDYNFPNVPTTPIKSSSTPPTNPLLDKFVAVDQKLSQSKARLSSLNQRMQSETNSDKKIALYSAMSSAQKVHDTMQRNLGTIHSQLSNPKKAAALDRELTGMSSILVRTDQRMANAYTKSMPVAPSSNPKSTPTQSQKLDQRLRALRNQGDQRNDTTPKGPHR